MKWKTRWIHLSTVALVGSLGLYGCAEDTTGAQEQEQAPATTITDGPMERTNEVDASFEFECEAGEYCAFECRLDDGEWSVCETPALYEGLEDGEHTLEVRAASTFYLSGGGVGGEGESELVYGEPDQWSWTIDTVVPEVLELDGPQEYTADTDATFTFECSKEDCTYQCSVDGGEFESCEPGVVYSELEDGAHTFEVFATDDVGNESEVVSWDWTVDTVNPVIEELTGPADPTNETAATFEFACSQDGCTFYCQIDEGPVEECASGVSYDELEDGDHVVTVYAVDQAGNQGPAATYEWEVDTIAPEVTITAGPEELTNEADATFELECSEDGCTFYCDVDGQGASECTSGQTFTGLADGAHSLEVYATDEAGNTGDSVTWDWAIDTVAPEVTITSGPDSLTNEADAAFEFECSEASCTFYCAIDGATATECPSGQAYTGLADGAHTFEVYATDEAGNTGDAVTYEWTVDTTAPTVTITSGPDSLTNEADAAFAFECSEASCTFYCAIDGAAATECTSGQAYAGLADGGHSFAVYATDEVGNTGDAVTWDWTIDTVAPTVTITSGPADPTNETDAAFAFECSEASCTFYCAIDGAAATECTSGQAYTGLADGDHTFEVYSTDEAGNTGDAVSWDWTVDTVAPTVTITSGPDDPTRDDAATFAFECSETNCTFYCELDGGGFAECLSGQTYTELEEGERAFAVYATDEAGNTGDEVSWEWLILLEPVINNISNQQTFNRSGGGWTGEGSGLSISEDRGHLAVWDDYNTVLYVLDLATRTPVGTYALGGGGSGKGLDYSDDGAFLFGVNNTGNWLVKVDTADYTPVTSIDPPGVQAGDVRVISDDRLVVTTGDRVLLYDFDLNLLSSALTPHAGFMAFDEEESKIYVSGNIGYGAVSGIARVDLDEGTDTLVLDWEEASLAQVSGIYPMSDSFLQADDSGLLQIRDKTDRSVINSYQGANYALYTSVAGLNSNTVIAVVGNTGEVVQYSERDDAFTVLGSSTGTTQINGVEVTENYLGIYWNRPNPGLELWDVQISF